MPDHGTSLSTGRGAFRWNTGRDRDTSRPGPSGRREGERDVVPAEPEGVGRGGAPTPLTGFTGHQIQVDTRAAAAFLAVPGIAVLGIVVLGIAVLGIAVLGIAVLPSTHPQLARMIRGGDGGEGPGDAGMRAHIAEPARRLVPPEAD